MNYSKGKVSIIPRFLIKLKKKICKKKKDLRKSQKIG